MQRPEFEWSNGDGPPHQRTFETTVTVGNLLCTGKGRSKKESRRKATEAMLNFFNKTLIYHWSHHKRGWHSFLLESLFHFYLRAPYREDGLSYFHEGQRNQEPVITALSSHNSNRKSIFCGSIPAVSIWEAIGISYNTKAMLRKKWEVTCWMLNVFLILSTHNKEQKICTGWRITLISHFCYLKKGMWLFVTMNFNNNSHLSHNLVTTDMDCIVINTFM